MYLIFLINLGPCYTNRKNISKESNLAKSTATWANGSKMENTVIQLEGSKFVPANKALKSHWHLEILNLCRHRDMCTEIAKYTQGEMQTQMYRGTDSYRVDTYVCMGARVCLEKLQTGFHHSRHSWTILKVAARKEGKVGYTNRKGQDSLSSSGSSIVNNIQARSERPHFHFLLIYWEKKKWKGKKRKKGQRLLILKNNCYKETNSRTMQLLSGA